MSTRYNRPWTAALLAAAAAAAAGCTGSPPGQVLTGRIAGTQSAVAIRAVADDEAVTAAQVRSDGSFTLAVPAGQSYRLEVLTPGGVKGLATGAGPKLVGVSFRVCAPVDPFDCGQIGGPGAGSGSGGGGGPGCDPGDPSCKPPPPPPCDPSDPSCPPPPPPCDPSTDPSCPPPPPPWPCDPSTDPSCKPPPPPPPCDPGDPSCPPPPPPPPCEDPTDPGSCKDPCMADPATCGCAPDDPGCWGAPPPCGPSGCAPDKSMVPEHPPLDFGCKELPSP